MNHQGRPAGCGRSPQGHRSPGSSWRASQGNYQNSFHAAVGPLQTYSSCHTLCLVSSCNFLTHSKEPEKSQSWQREKKMLFFLLHFCPGPVFTKYLLEDCTFENELRTRHASKKPQWFESCFHCKLKTIPDVPPSENVSNIQSDDLSRHNSIVTLT